MKTYIWSDMHLGHTKIIEYCNRPFASIKEMDKTIIKNWRSTVTNKDTIINLGDICVSNIYNKNRLAKLIRNLPGYKILIMGNHDKKKSPQFWRKVGFQEVYKYPIIYRQRYILSHVPVFFNKMPYINIHGHIHNNKYEQLSHINVSVEQTNYIPLNFDKLIAQSIPYKQKKY